MGSRKPAFGYYGRLALLGVVYLAAARLGLMLGAVSGFATLVWPATGIALAALLRGGLRFWPAIAAGAFAANLWTGAPVLAAAAIAVGNTLEAVIAAVLFGRFGLRPSLDRVRDVLGLVGAAVPTTLLSAVVGVTSLHLAGVVSEQGFALTLRAWWLGDLIGDLIAAPLLLTWSVPAGQPLQARRKVEAIGVALATLALGWLVFHGPGMPPGGIEWRQAYMIFPPLIWAALRFEQRGAALTTFAASVLAIAGTVRGLGPFAQPVLHESLIALQAFMSIAALTALTLGAVISERSRAEREAARHAARVQLLADASHTYAEASLDLERALAAVAAQIGGALGATCVISLLRDEGRTLETAAAYDAHPDAQRLLSATAHEPRPVEALPPGAVIRSGRTLLISDADPKSAADAVDPRFREYLARFPPRSLLAVPLRTRGEVFGSIAVSRHASGRVYGQDDAVLLEDLAERAALAIENARLFRHTRDAIALRDEFLSVASHELRTPLSAVMLQLEGLRRWLKSASASSIDAKFGAKLDKVARAAGRLTKLVDNLLDVSRIATDRLDLRIEECDLSEIARDTVERATEHARSCGSELLLTCDPRVAGSWDRLRVEQVLTNLVSNAIKYGSGRPIEVTVKRTGESALVSVRDHGIGISSSDAERIFNRFERAAPVEQYGGLGLGLFITRQIVEAHDGRITVTSEPGAGATFVVELPRRPATLRSGRESQIEGGT